MLNNFKKKFYLISFSANTFNNFTFFFFKFIYRKLKLFLKGSFLKKVFYFNLSFYSNFNLINKLNFFFYKFLSFNFFFKNLKNFLLSDFFKYNNGFKAKLRVFGIGWKFWLLRTKKKNFYIRVRIGHSFFIRFFFFFKLGIKKLTYYIFYIFLLNFKKFNILLNKVIKSKPVFTYKLIGIYNIKKKINLKKVRKDPGSRW